METTWFCILMFMLGTYVVLGGTDLGVGMMLLLAGRDESERWQIIRSIRPVWKPNEVWLVAAGGTMFLAFPTALAVSFSGFYLALTVVVWLLAFRGLGLELRYQLPDVLWRQFWDAAVSVSSLLLALFLGTALGNVVRGVPLDANHVFFEPLWTDLRVGEKTGILDWYTVTAGITAVLALAYQGALWLNARADGDVRDRAHKLARLLGPGVLLFFALLDLCSVGAAVGIGFSVADHRRLVRLDGLGAARSRVAGVPGFVHGAGGRAGDGGGGRVSEYSSRARPGERAFHSRFRGGGGGFANRVVVVAAGNGARRVLFSFYPFENAGAVFQGRARGGMRRRFYADNRRRLEQVG
jgi:hypothetical protein